jgi:hypothetical protein
MLTGAGSPTTNSGTFAFDNAGYLVGSFQDSTGGGTTTVTLNYVGKPLEYAGKYSGSWTSTSGSKGTMTATISAAGAISGSGPISTGGQVSVSGTVSTTGILNLTVVSPGGTDTNTGGAAFDAAGHLIIVAVDSGTGGSVVTVTLSRT